MQATPGHDPQPTPPSRGLTPPKTFNRVWHHLRTYFLTGVLVVAPIGITLYLAWAFIDFIDVAVVSLIPQKYNPKTYLPYGIPGLGLVIVIIGLTLVGWAAAGFVGRLVLRMGERIVQRMPVIRNIYGAAKQIVETVVARQSNAFRKAVLVEYPRPGVWAIAFVTGRAKGEVQRATGEDYVNVFVPTTPNPTSGFLLFVPKKQVVALDMTVEEAIKLVVSCGLVVPPDRGTAESDPKVARFVAPAKTDIPSAG
ncbi:MAG: DUF502 domain-containing protein [Rhodospirillales bacterium]|nr:DUF502 domain-containing protein [Rhodospirillales bacterium]